MLKDEIQEIDEELRTQALEAVIGLGIPEDEAEILVDDYLENF